MGEAKKKKRTWPKADHFRGVIDFHMLPPVPSINGARIRELTGDSSLPDSPEIILQAFRVSAGARTFHVGFCLGDETGFSAIGYAVIERLMMEAPGTLNVVSVVHEDIAWDIVLRHLQTFTGNALLFAFPNSDVYDAGSAEKYYSPAVRVFTDDGQQSKRLTDAQRHKIREQKAALLDRPPPPRFYDGTNIVQTDSPWIFRFATPAGKVVRVAAWNGRRDYAHEFPAEILEWVGGDKIAIAQVDSPVGINRRSALNLTHWLAKDFDGIVHWARDTETFHSILRSFIRLDLESVGPPELPVDWKPEITFLGANDSKIE